MVDPIDGTKHGFVIRDGTADGELQSFLKNYPEKIHCFIVSPKDLGVRWKQPLLGKNVITVAHRVNPGEFYINHLS